VVASTRYYRYQAWLVASSDVVTTQAITARTPGKAVLNDRGENAAEAPYAGPPSSQCGAR